jgi:hypothetical protein
MVAIFLHSDVRKLLLFIILFFRSLLTQMAYHQRTLFSQVFWINKKGKEKQIFHAILKLSDEFWGIISSSMYKRNDNTLRDVYTLCYVLFFQLFSIFFCVDRSEELRVTSASSEASLGIARTIQSLEGISIARRPYVIRAYGNERSEANYVLIPSCVKRNS